MAIRVLRQFNSLGRYCYGASLMQGQQDLLGVLLTLKDTDPADVNVAFALIPLQKQGEERYIVFDGRGPSNLLAVEMLLRYDPISMGWIIAQLQNAEYLAMRTTSITQNGEIRLSPLCLLDYDEAAESPGMTAPLALEVENDRIILIYPKPVDVHAESPQVMKLEVILQHSVWDALEDTSASLEPGTIPSDLDVRSEEVFLPENAIFDPSTNKAHQTAGVRIVNRSVLAQAELSMVYADQHINLLVLCGPEHMTQVGTQMKLPEGTSHEGKQWRFWLTGWDHAWNTHRWTYAPDFGVPFPLDPATDVYRYVWPTAYVDAIAGPSIPERSTATVVVALKLGQPEQGLSQGVCLDEDGQVVQMCSAPLGERPTLCCCERTIVGVDFFKGNWRIWNWSVLERQGLGKSLSLEATCQRAFVRAEPASERFWLIEELPEGVRITRRHALTLESIAAESFLPEVELRLDPEDHPLNGYQQAGLISYQDSLLLLANSVQTDELALYQIR